MLDIFILIFLDNFLIFSKMEEEHIQHVSHVLQQVIDLKLACNLKKCQFHIKKVEFLGYEVSGRGVNMIDDRVKVIKDWAPVYGMRVHPQLRKGGQAGEQCENRSLQEIATIVLGVGLEIYLS